MKKLFTILMVVAMSTTVSFSQISDRVNDESTYLLGARPVAGNFGFFFGMSTVDIMELSDNDWQESGIPLINVKYYKTDKLVLKAGVQVWKKRRSIDGKLDGYMTEYKHVETDANWDLALGAEKHFDLSNIIDAYIGLNGNIGYERSVRVNNISYDGGDYRNDEGSNFGFTYGLETVIGSNFFIADLPLAVGFETGFSAKNYGANKYKYDWDEVQGGTANSGTYYTSLVDDFEDVSANDVSNSQVQFTELTARRFDIMPLARVTFTYYLKQ
jgi:hypothetical protein